MSKGRKSKHQRNRALITRRERGESIVALAKRYGIRRQAVSQIIQRHAPHLMGQPTPTSRRDLATKACVECGQFMYGTKSRLRRKKFCSHACHLDHRSNARELMPRIVRLRSFGHTWAAIGETLDVRDQAVDLGLIGRDLRIAHGPGIGTGGH